MPSQPIDQLSKNLVSHCIGCEFPNKMKAFVYGFFLLAIIVSVFADDKIKKADGVPQVVLEPTNDILAGLGAGSVLFILAILLS